MSVIFAYETARAYYRLAAAGLVRMPHDTSIDPLADARGGLRHIRGCQDMPLSLSVGELMSKGVYPSLEPYRLSRSISEQELAELKDRLLLVDDVGFSIDQPLEVLVADPHKRGKFIRHAVRPHACTVPLSSNSFRRIGQTAYVPSPELLFLEMTQRDKRIHAIAAFGCELCGGYSLLPRGLASVRGLLCGRNSLDPGWLTPQDVLLSEGYVACKPRTSSARLIEYIEGLPPNLPGIVVARTALRWIRDGSRSPMETASSLQLQLPRLRGGFGVGSAEFNVRYPIGDKWQRVLHKPYVVVDELFCGRNGQLAAIEYNGGIGHFARSNVMSDNQRRHALEDTGLRVVFVTARDFRDLSTWEKIGEGLAYYLGKNYDPATSAMLEARRLVHGDLANPLFLK